MRTAGKVTVRSGCGTRGARTTKNTDRARRAADIAVASIGLAATSPLLVAISVVIRWTMGRPVLFAQNRAGFGGQPFRLLKFRTMRPPKPGQEGPDRDGDRLTRSGAFLRSTSLDELPSLWNLLVGDITLVGPRPLPVRYLGRYSPQHARRHEVKPGITGHAQVNGRNDIGWRERLDLDVWYVDHRSLRLDLRILRRTAAQVLRREGISQQGHPTMPEFEGLGGTGGAS